MFLLDTNIISETRKHQPDGNVIAWLSNVADSSLYVSALSLGEIRKGITKTRDILHREVLLNWIENEIKPWFSDRILPVDISVCEQWGNILGCSKRTLPAIDSLLAATALHYRLALVTRNISDFTVPNLDVINPWDASFS